MAQNGGLEWTDEEIKDDVDAKVDYWVTACSNFIHFLQPTPGVDRKHGWNRFDRHLIPNALAIDVTHGGKLDMHRLHWINENVDEFGRYIAIGCRGDGEGPHYEKFERIFVSAARLLVSFGFTSFQNIDVRTWVRPLGENEIELCCNFYVVHSDKLDKMKIDS
jgi:hypothetical protein